MKNRPGRIAVGAFVAFCLVFGFAAVSSAQTFNPESLKITVTKIVFIAQSGAETDMGVSSQEFTITDGDPGAVLGTIISGFAITGTLTSAKVTIACTMKVKASFTVGGTTFFTKADGSFGTSGPAVEATFTIPSCPAGGFTQTFNFDDPVTVAAGQTKTIRVSFNNSLSQSGSSVDGPGGNAGEVTP